MRTNRRVLSCICALIALLFLFSAFPASAAEEADEKPSLEEARAVWFSHLESGLTVLSKDGEMQVGAGSTVKVMAGLLLCEELYEHRHTSVELEGDLWETASPYFSGRCLQLEAGDSTLVEELLYAALCGSYNDAFYLLATYLDGSPDAFVERMNTRADEIGMRNTDFRDLTGIKSGSRTTASDMAKLASVAYENDYYMKLCGTVSYTFSSLHMEEKFFYNNNFLVCQYQQTKYYQSYCTGMSAGSSDDGNCVVTVAEHDGETYICVVLGGLETDTDLYGYHVANRMIEWVYKTYQYLDVVSPESVIGSVPVSVSDTTTEVELYTDETLSAYLPRGAEEEIVYSIRLATPTLEAPFEENTFVGYLAVVYEGRVLGTVKLYTRTGAERSGLIGSLKNIQALAENRALVAGVIFFVVALTAWLVTEYVLQRRRRHRWDKYFSDKMEMPDTLMKERRPDPNRLRAHNSPQNRGQHHRPKK